MTEILDFLRSTGFNTLDWRNGVMLAVAFIFIFLAISKELEPYELLPIGLGIIVANLGPSTGLLDFAVGSSEFQESGIFGIVFHYGLSFWNLLPPIIFLGLGAMTDFGPVFSPGLPMYTLLLPDWFLVPARYPNAMLSEPVRLPYRAW